MIRGEARARILKRLADELRVSVPPEAVIMARHLAAHFGPAVAAVLFYGSCLRSGRSDGLLDFYVLVDSYAEAISSPLSAGATRLLPPAVYHHVLPVDDRLLRAKVAVVSLEQLAKRVHRDGLDTSFWARFCQPLALLHVREAATVDKLLGILCDAVITASWWAAALGPEAGRPEDCWQALFSHTYAAELRAERDGRAAALWAAAPPRYAEMLEDAWQAAGLARAPAGSNPLPPTLRVRHHGAWQRRRVAGKLLNVARLIKASFTFEGGADYLAWKIERHSGQRIALTEFQRHHPLLAAPALLCRLMHRRIVR